MNLAPHQRRRIPYVAITLALQHKQTQYELTSELLSDMFGRILNPAQVQQGFLMVLNELGELIIDFPKASEVSSTVSCGTVTDGQLSLANPLFLACNDSIRSNLEN